MEKECLGFKTKVEEGKLIIEISVDGIVSGFNGSPNNYEELNVIKGKEEKFAELVSDKLRECGDSETGNTILMDAFDRAFEEIIESGTDIINYGDNE